MYEKISSVLLSLADLQLNLKSEACRALIIEKIKKELEAE